MKKSVLLLSTLAFFIVFGFMSCDDDLNTIGGSIQPPSDIIKVGSDTLGVKARTHSFQDSVYAQALNGVLGKYKDDMFGSIKSDYLCQLYFPEGTKFKDKVISFDSINFVIDYTNYLGDSISTMGLSVYKVKNQLPSYFFTNTDPAKYVDMANPIANQAFSVSSSKIIAVSSGVIYRQAIANMDIKFAEDLHSAIESGTIKDPESFNKYFPGMYVTTTFGSGTLIHPNATSIEISYHYEYLGRNADDTADSTRVERAVLALTSTTEVNQLNHIENKIPDEIFNTSSDMVYAKTPAGVCPEITFPIKEIAENMNKNGYSAVNTALFSIWGYTEKEPTGTFDYQKPSTLLLVNKDSVDYFFQNRQKPNGFTTLVASRNTSSNSYEFNNLSRLITIYKDKNLKEDPKFLLIPVTLQYDSYQSSILNVYNLMSPSASIYRNNIDNMRLTLIYTKF